MFRRRSAYRMPIQVGVALTNYEGALVIDFDQTDRRPRIRVSVGVGLGSGEIRVKQFGLMLLTSAAVLAERDTDVPIAPSQVPTVLGQFFLDELPEPTADEGPVVGYLLAECGKSAASRQVISESVVSRPQPEVEQPVVAGVQEWLQLVAEAGHQLETEGRTAKLTLRESQREAYGIVAPLAEWFDCVEIRGGAGSVARIILPWRSADLDLRGSDFTGVDIERPPLQVEQAMGMQLSGELSRPLVALPASVKLAIITDARLNPDASRSTAGVGV